MKTTILVIDEDPVYSKKFVNLAIKLFGKKYIFLTFSDLRSLKEYIKENRAEAVVLSDTLLENVDDLKTSFIYVLNEKTKNTHKEGKRTFVYRYQNVNNILEKIDKDIDAKYEKSDIKDNTCKLILFYTPIYVKNKLEVIKRIGKNLPKNKKALIIDIDEFENYKGTVGLSNLIFNYKENNLTQENTRKEIVTEKDQDFIKSITYPEDMNVINNIDLANIVNETTKLGYDYVFVNSDQSYVKSQYILNDADDVIIIKDKDSEKIERFKNYIKNENQFDLKRVTEFEIDKMDKAYVSNFVKQCF